jgi:hypothetical protein
VPEANCNPWSGRSYACLSKEENFNFSEYILQYLPTRFNKSRTQDVNSSNDAIKNLKFPFRGRILFSSQQSCRLDV